jgi:hypothetical protein
MSDEPALQHESGAALTERITALLGPLGGRTAVAAQRFGPPPPASAASEVSIAIRTDEVFPPPAWPSCPSPSS